MLTFLLVIVVGGIVGWLATLILGEEKQHGIFGNILIGIVGSFLAGLASAVLTGKDRAELGTLTWESFIWSFVGAVFLLLVVRAIRRNRTAI